MCGITRSSADQLAGVIVEVHRALASLGRATPVRRGARNRSTGPIIERRAE
jgi:hypothetical protein